MKACHKHCTTVPSEDDAIGGSGGKIVAKMLNRAVRIGRLARTKTRIGHCVPCLIGNRQSLVQEGWS